MLEKSKEILNIIEDFATKNKLTKFIKIDHLCYKCKSKKEYDTIRKFFEMDCKFFYQAIISGRRIGVIKLSTPIKTKIGNMEYIELSDFEANEPVKGFQHVEIIPKNISVEKFVKGLEKVGLKIVHGGNHTKTHYFYLGKYKVKITKESILEIIREEMISK